MKNGPQYLVWVAVSSQWWNLRLTHPLRLSRASSWKTQHWSCPTPSRNSAESPTAGETCPRDTGSTPQLNWNPERHTLTLFLLVCGSRHITEMLSCSSFGDQRFPQKTETNLPSTEHVGRVHGVFQGSVVHNNLTILTQDTLNVSSYTEQTT